MCALRSTATQEPLPHALVEDLDVAEPRAAGEDDPRCAVHRGALLLRELADEGAGAHLHVHPLGHQQDDVPERRTRVDPGLLRGDGGLSQIQDNGAKI